MKVAVTGAGGFVGTHVLDALVRTGCRVVAVAREVERVTGPFHEAFQWDTGQATCDVYERFGRPDVLIHLAWGGLPNYTSAVHTSYELPRQRAFLEALVKGGLPAVFVAGTCLEYGLVEGSVDETVPARPTTSYGIAKDLLRQYLEDVRKTRQFRLVWGRLFYLFGKGQSERSLFGQFSRAVAEQRIAFEMSPGDQVRDYLSVEEASRNIVDLALCPAADGVFNICSGEPLTVRELVEGWLFRSGSSMRMSLGKLPYSAYEPRNFWGNRGKLDRALARRL